MSEKRFTSDKVEKGNAILSVRITDNVTDDNYFIMTKEAYEDDIDDIVALLNEQQATINKLKEEEKLYAQEILRLNTLLKQYQANQDLGGGY